VSTEPKRYAVQADVASRLTALAPRVGSPKLAGRGKNGKRASIPRFVALLFGLAWAVVIVGCGSGDSANHAVTPPGVPYALADAIHPGMTRAAVRERLGTPVLTSHPTTSALKGCAYYAMAGRPLGDVWQFCFDSHNRVHEGATLYALSQPPPPAGASAARAVLLARGDAICQSESGRLADPAQKLARLRPTSAPHARREAAGLMRRLNAVLRKALAELGAFDAPPDGRRTLASYLEALAAQTRALDRARAALAASQDGRYARLLRSFNRFGSAAAARARRYGFTVCSATNFS
jgi:hypothetical protein